jgi:nucleoside-diphosphate-sugar epimerase
MTKVLVTGATGFVGACLTRRLVNLGYDVHLFTRRESDRWRIADLLGRVREHEVNLRDRLIVEKAVRSISPKIICHLATYGGFASQRESTAIYEVNLLGTVNLLRACEQAGFDLFINTGSSSEYGVKAQPMRENDLLEPIGDYGVSKAAATLFCSAEAREKELPIVTLRLFSPYGPWDDPKRLIPFVVKSFLRGEVPKLSIPASVRDYIFIDDVVDSYLRLIENPPVQGEIFNIGSGQQYSIGEVVKQIAALVGTDAVPQWGAVSSQKKEPNCWVADREKAERLLEWRPKASLHAGLENTIHWIRSNLSLYV